MQTNFDFEAKNTLVELKEYKVSELSTIIKKTLENSIGVIKVRGEISGLKIATSGHGYFNLKDVDAILACTCWKPVLSKLPFALKDGIEVAITGKLTTYPGQSRYQLNVEKIEAAGAGVLMQIFIELKTKLAAEGLFDVTRKKPLPFMPSKIGIVTSMSGAVIKDMLHRINERCGTHLIIWPVLVQGENAKFEISEAINGFNSFSPALKPDLLIVARGGGSIEDLWSFNEEIVVRAAANSSIPIISAIGHETDFTLLDFVADRRAPTPTAAAEFAVPVLSDLQHTINVLELRFKNVVASLLKYLTEKLNTYQRFFKDPLKILYSREQRLDELSFYLATSLPNHLKVKTMRVNFIKLPAQILQQRIEHRFSKVQNLYQMISERVYRLIEQQNQHLELQNKLLISLDVKQILKRGFTLIRDNDGKIVTTGESLQQNQIINVDWYNNSVKAKVI